MIETKTKTAVTKYYPKLDDIIKASSILNGIVLKPQSRIFSATIIFI